MLIDVPLVKVTLYMVVIIILVGCSRPVMEAEKNKQYEQSRKAAETVIFDLVAASQSCSIDADCSVENLNCPFGCGTGLNTSKKDAVVAAVENYQKEFSACLYRCKILQEVSCRNNVCVAHE